MNIEKNVLQRYSQGAAEKQSALCCPVEYDQSLLQILPQEVVEKDYGCGDPSRYVEPGDTVLDLGSGGGKICYMAAQLTGERGRVIGVDMNDDMLALARKYQQPMQQRIGGPSVEFFKGYIQDLSLDLQARDEWLTTNPVTDGQGLLRLREWQQQQKTERPLIADRSVNLVISNCVLNLVARRDRQQMIAEIFRVLKPGGRVAISDIVADERVPERLQQDEQLWSACVSGAFEEKEFIDLFVAAGFVM